MTTKQRRRAGSARRGSCAISSGAPGPARLEKNPTATGWAHPATVKGRCSAYTRRANAMVMAVAMSVLLAIIGSAFVMMARLDRQAVLNVADDQLHDTAVHTVLNRIQKVLADDVVGGDGSVKLLDNGYKEGEDGNELTSREPYDFPGKKDPWLANIEPYHVSLPSNEYEYRWLQSSEILYDKTRQNKYLPAIPYDADFDRYEESYLVNTGSPIVLAAKPLETTNDPEIKPVEDPILIHPITGNLPRMYDYNKVFTPYDASEKEKYAQYLADADGDGITDSIWRKLEGVDATGKDVLYAVRIVDNCGKLNLNTAWKMEPARADMSDGFRPWTDVEDIDADSYGEFLHQINLSRLFHNNSLTPTLEGDNVQQEIHDLRGIGNLDTNEVYQRALRFQEFVIQNFNYWPADLFSPGTPDASLEQYVPFGLEDEMELRNRFLLNANSDTRLEIGDPGGGGYLKQALSDNGIYRILPFDDVTNWYTYIKSIDKRHLVTTYSYDRELRAYSPDLSSVPEQELDEVAGKFRKVNINDVLNDVREWQTDGNVTNRDRALKSIRAIALAFESCGYTFLQGIQYVANLVDFIDDNDIPTYINAGMVRTAMDTTGPTPSADYNDYFYGTEKQPFITEVYNDVTNNEEDGLVCNSSAIELYNPYNDINLNGLYLCYVPPGWNPFNYFDDPIENPLPEESFLIHLGENSTVSTTLSTNERRVYVSNSSMSIDTSQGATKDTYSELKIDPNHDACEIWLLRVPENDLTKPENFILTDVVRDYERAYEEEGVFGIDYLRPDDLSPGETRVCDISRKGWAPNEPHKWKFARNKFAGEVGTNYLGASSKSSNEEHGFSIPIADRASYLPEDENKWRVNGLHEFSQILFVGNPHAGAIGGSYDDTNGNIVYDLVIDGEAIIADPRTITEIIQAGSGLSDDDLKKLHPHTYLVIKKDETIKIRNDEGQIIDKTISHYVYEKYGYMREGYVRPNFYGWSVKNDDSGNPTLLDRISCFARTGDHLDNNDNDRDGRNEKPDPPGSYDPTPEAVDELLECRIPGRININTAPLSVIKTVVPWLTVDGINRLREGEVNGELYNDYSAFIDEISNIIGSSNDAIARNIPSEPNGLYFSSMGYIPEKKMESGTGYYKGYKTPYDVMEVLASFDRSENNETGNPLAYTFDFANFVSSTKTWVLEHLSDPQAVPEFGTIGIDDDLEERYWVPSRIANLLTIRSDTFTAYIVVRVQDRNNPAENYTERRYVATIDRSNVFLPKWAGENDKDDSGEKDRFDPDGSVYGPAGKNDPDYFDRQYCWPEVVAFRAVPDPR